MIPTRRVIGKLKHFSRLPAGDRMLTIEASVLLGAARLCLLAVPFRRIAEKLGTPYPAGTTGNVLTSCTEQDHAVACRISSAVRRAAKNVPFRAVCIHQALVAKLMLERRGVASVMHFGVGRNRRDGEPMRAHAWLNTATVEITGFPVDEEFTEIAYFM